MYNFAHLSVREKHQFALTAVKTHAYTVFELFFFQVKEHNKINFTLGMTFFGTITYDVPFFND